MIRNKQAIEIYKRILFFLKIKVYTKGECPGLRISCIIYPGRFRTAAAIGTHFRIKAIIFGEHIKVLRLYIHIVMICKRPDVWV